MREQCPYTVTFQSLAGGFNLFSVHSQNCRKLMAALAVCQEGGNSSSTSSGSSLSCESCECLMGFLGDRGPQAVCGEGPGGSKDRQLLEGTKTLGNSSFASQTTHHQPQCPAGILRTGNRQTGPRCPPVVLVHSRTEEDIHLEFPGEHAALYTSRCMVGRVCCCLRSAVTMSVGGVHRWKSCSAC